MKKEELTLEGKFKTATQLWLTDKQYCGLIQTLAHLEAGTLDHENDITLGFDMGVWGGRCGTVCCIGGTAEALVGRGVFSRSAAQISRAQPELPPELRRLFYPHSESRGWSATTAQAAVALRHYLETGKTNWSAAMATPEKRRK